MPLSFTAMLALTLPQKMSLNLAVGLHHVVQREWGLREQPKSGSLQRAGGLKFWVQVKARLTQQFCISTSAQEPCWVNAVPGLAAESGREGAAKMP